MTDSEYIQFNPFQSDRDVDVRLQTVRIVTTRTLHRCASPQECHDIAPGTRARFEKALIDGDTWGSYYTCLACIDEEVGL